ncbi:MAG: GNAT family N-acetyltransferase [Candidatus Helarchaeota archaeon]
MDVKIRIMEKTDIDFCTKIVTELLGEPEDVTNDTLNEYYEDEQETSLMLVAEIEGKLVGFAGILIEFWNATGNIEWIAIIEEYRRRGIGSKLLKELVDYAKKKKVRKIYVDTAVDNLAAISYYIKNRFFPEAVLREFYLNGKDALKLAYKI